VSTAPHLVSYLVGGLFSLAPPYVFHFLRFEIFHELLGNG
jgi:hypothetical protein